MKDETEKRRTTNMERYYLGIEDLHAADYVVRAGKDSKFKPGAILIFETGIICPGCRKQSEPELNHGETRVCPYCGMKITRWGNMLECRPGPVLTEPPAKTEPLK